MPFHLQVLLPGLLLALGYGLGDIDEAGLLAGALYVGWVLSGERLPSWLWWFGALASSVALAIHVAPGFSPHVLGGPLQYSPDAGPVWLRLSWDKALVGVTLLAWWLGKAVPYDTRRIAAGQAMRADCCRYPCRSACPSVRNGISGLPAQMASTVLDLVFS